MAKSKRAHSEESRGAAAGNSRVTVGGPADASSFDAATDALTATLGTHELAGSRLFNPLKASEYEPHVLEGPEIGRSVVPREPIVGASTVTERNVLRRSGAVACVGRP